MSVDEFEVIRLIDYGRKTHEQCAQQMEISRTTVTEMYESARFKLANSLVNGKPLRISGGNYRLCSGSSAYCCGRICEKAVCRKENGKMRIAVTYENGNVFQHFGHTAQFKIYDAENGIIEKEQLADTAGSGHGALAGFLKSLGTDVLICGGIGGGAQQALDQAGIRFYGGVSGSADEAVKALLEGKLVFNANVHCSHHEQGHSCGGHQCGEDKHGCSGNGGSQL
ncbi:hypothetical protein Osc1_02560 [Hominimerdicola sp. 21CYCFAH17_S]